MVSIKQVGDAGFALTLSVGVGVFSLVIAMGQGYGVATMVSIGMSFGVAYLLYQRYPTVETNLLWKFGGISLILFVAGNAVTTNSIYAPNREVSPLVVGSIWFFSLTVAYLVVAGGVLSSLEQRFVSW